MGAVERYLKTNIRRFVVNINRRTMPDVLEFMETKENVQGYLLGLIRADMAAQAAEEEPADES